MTGSTEWENYEEVAHYLLDQMAEHFGLDRVEGKQGVIGKRSGTTYTIDAKGVAADDEAFILVECRRHITARQKQEDLAAIAYRIIDTGARGGIVVTPLSLQTGAARIAAAEGIVHVKLGEGSTTETYVLSFLNQVFVGLVERLNTGETIVHKISRASEM